MPQLIDLWMNGEFIMDLSAGEGTVERKQKEHWGEEDGGYTNSY